MLHLYVPASLRHFAPRRAAKDPCVPLYYDLTHALRPRLAVDLGAGHCSAFFAICDAVKEHDFDCACYAFEPWAEKPEGDEPRFNPLILHGRRYHMGISYFVKLEPVKALAHFDDGMIDLLRVDASRGLIPAEQLEQWRRRVSPTGALVVDGLHTPEGQEFWRAAGQPEQGFRYRRIVVLVGGEVDRSARLLDLLSDSGEHADLRGFYEHVADHHRMRQDVDAVGFASAKKAKR